MTTRPLRLPIDIDPDIRRAWTLPAGAYASAEALDLQRRGLFARSWQLVTSAHEIAAPGRVAPWTLLEGSLDEPLLAVRDALGEVRVISNVCTHRGALIVDAPGPARALRCPYHGRRFDLDGRFRSMPGFDEAKGFPSATDDLPEVASGAWGRLLFASLGPERAFAEWIEPARRFDWLPWDRFRFDPDTSRDYPVAASWLAYCDNYLEGFHIPFVHPALAPTIDYGSYRTELFEDATLQVAIAADGEPAFDLPPSHADHGQRVAAYYLFLFPNTMLNLYPWGLSVNQVLPQGPSRCLVRFQSWVRDPALRDLGAGAELHRVELEDEQVVESVQRGLGSRLYHRGRYSPTHETGVHHFHRYVARTMNETGAA